MSDDNDNGDTAVIERGLVAIIRKFLESKIVWRAFATVALSLGVIQRELPAKVDVETAPSNAQVSKDNFMALQAQLTGLETSINTLTVKVEDLETKLAYMSGKLSTRNADKN